MDFNEYINGYIERRGEGKCEGVLKIEGIDLSPIVGFLFKRNDKTYLWLRRKDMLVYDAQMQKYITRKREPRWEAYLEKQMSQNGIVYRGEFPFMRFKFSIVGLWDSVFGREKSRLNFYVERLPMERQDLLKAYNKH